MLIKNIPIIHSCYSRFGGVWTAEEAMIACADMGIKTAIFADTSTECWDDIETLVKSGFDKVKPLFGITFVVEVERDMKPVVLIARNNAGRGAIRALECLYEWGEGVTIDAITQYKENLLVVLPAEANWDIIVSQSSLLREVVDIVAVPFVNECFFAVPLKMAHSSLQDEMIAAYKANVASILEEMPILQSPICYYRSAESSDIRKQYLENLEDDPGLEVAAAYLRNDWQATREASAQLTTEQLRRMNAGYHFLLSRICEVEEADYRRPLQPLATADEVYAFAAQYGVALTGADVKYAMESTSDPVHRQLYMANFVLEVLQDQLELLKNCGEDI